MFVVIKGPSLCGVDCRWCVAKSHVSDVWYLLLLAIQDKGQGSILRLLSYDCGQSSIWLHVACVLDVWDDVSGAVSNVFVDGAPRTIFSESIPECFPEAFVLVSVDAITFTVDPLFCQSERCFLFLLLTRLNQALDLPPPCSSSKGVASIAKFCGLDDFSHIQYPRILWMIDLWRPPMHISLRYCSS